jgi:superfamily II DNA or RNA helicase
MFKITPRNNRGVIEGPVSEQIEQALQSKYVWYDPDDLTNEKLFYADTAMYLGVMYDMASFINEEFDMDCVVELPELDLPRHDWTFNWEYRPRQEDAVNLLIEKRFGIAHAPPGFGKTVVASAVTAKIGYRTAIIVQAEEPLNQAYHTMLRATNIKPGRVSGEHKKLAEVTVYMVQTLSQELENNPDGEIAQWYRSAKVIIVDECHHAGASSYMTVLDAPDDPHYVIGLSATPNDREDGKQDFVHAFFGKSLFEITFGQQIEDGTACPLTVYVDYMPPRDFGFTSKRSGADWQRRQQYTKVYDQYIINNADRNRMGVQFAREMNEDGLTVAMIVSRVEHAEVLHALMPEATIITSKTKNRDEIIYKLKRHEIKCVITTLFDEAVDVPSLGAVALLAGGKSKIKLKQRLRSTRVFDGDTVYGRYTKDRGYVWFPFDQCDFLRSHSQSNLAILKDLVSQHPDNKLVLLK